jgi:sugar phosphate isomerase/epimerase
LEVWEFLMGGLHFARLGATPALIRTTDPALVPYVQVSDAPRAAPSGDPLDWQREGRTARLLPGDGELPLIELIDAMPAGCPIAVEVPSLDARREVGDEAWARQALAATRRLLGDTETSLAGERPA